MAMVSARSDGPIQRPSQQAWAQIAHKRTHSRLRPQSSLAGGENYLYSPMPTGPCEAAHHGQRPPATISEAMREDDVTGETQPTNLATPTARLVRALLPPLTKPR